VRPAVVLLAAWAGGCATLAPDVPRFVLVHDQRTAACRVQLIRDTRSAACFAAFACARQPIVVLEVDAGVCKP
jgi:hypothetical protein